jgi:hypothetical protein
MCGGHGEFRPMFNRTECILLHIGHTKKNVKKNVLKGRDLLRSLRDVYS